MHRRKCQTRHKVLRRVLLGLLVLGLGGGTPAWAQGQIGSKDDCRSLRANVSGTAKADIPVSTAAVTVVAANQGRCSALIFNIGDQVIRCMSITDGTPTGTAGFAVLPGVAQDLGLASQRGLMCIRDTGATGDGLVTVFELFP